MRLLLTALLLLCALPAAAQQQETVSLRYYPAAQLDRLLLSRAAGTPKTGGPGQQSGAPEADRFSAYAAWTVDAAHNALVVTGTADAIAQIRRMARTVDVPPRKLSFRLMVVTSDPTALAALGLDKQKSGSIRSAPTTPAKVATLIAQAKAHLLAGARLPGKTGEAVRLVWPAAPKGPSTGAQPQLDLPGGALCFTPQVNSDGTINLHFSDPRQPSGETLLPDTWVLEHLPSGETFAVVLPTGEILEISVQLSPDSPR